MLSCRMPPYENEKTHYTDQGIMGFNVQAMYGPFFSHFGRL